MLMIICLERLNSNMEKEIKIDEAVLFDEQYIADSSINSLTDVRFVGKISRDTTEQLVLCGSLSGEMHIDDSISLEDVTYRFSIEIDEILEENSQNDKNTIDIIDILWQNIVLEVPLRYTVVDDISSYSGDGWKLVSEEEAKNNNPFLELREKYKEE